MPTKNKHTIAEHDLSPLAKAGIFVSRFETRNLGQDHEVHLPHRDTHYLFVLAEAGSFEFHLDFKQLQISNPTMMMIFPGQVHHITKVAHAKGWSLGFDPTLVPAALQSSLETGFNTPLSLDLSGTFFQQTTAIISVISQINHKSPGPLRTQSIHSLLAGLLALIAAELLENSDASPAITDRAHTIERDFQSLLKRRFKDWKQPSRYATELSISTAYLNDTVRSITDKSVTAHIQQLNILEAKRLLYRTDLSIKEIAYELGYEDPVHFGKLFKKLTKTTPLVFRRQIRE